MKKNINELTDQEIFELLEKANKTEEKRKEANKRWRMNNKETIANYHKQYNKERNEFIKRIKEEYKNRKNNVVE